MKRTKKSLTGKEPSCVEKGQKSKESDGWTGTEQTGLVSALKKSNAVSVVTPLTDSLTPFPNIDQVTSPTTNLIDDSTKQLKELMNSLVSVKSARDEENLFKSVNTVNAACNCAKQIQSLLRLKLDIYRSYKK